MADATELIVNPSGNRNRDGRQWMAVQRQCLRELAPAEVTVVESPAEAAAAAREAALEGYRKIVSVGDSRTAHGVVNGLMQLAEGHRRQLRVGFLSFSRPDLWSRTLELPRALGRQLEVLSAGHTLPYDVGQVRCEDDGGRGAVHYFLNGACFGVPGRLRADWRDPDANLLQTLPRLARALRNAGDPAGTHVRLENDEGVVYEGGCTFGILMEGRFYPAFGRIAPQADPTDGRLELAWLGEGSWWAMAAQLAGLWLGPLRHGPARLAWQSVPEVRATSLGGPVTVEVDGQPVGRLPATFSVAPRTLPVIVPQVAVHFRKPVFKPVEKLGNGRLAGNIKSAVGL